MLYLLWIVKKQPEKTMRNLLLAIACLLPTSIFAAEDAAESNTLPHGFVYLRDIDPTIIQDMRYATPDNFTGTVVPGYEEGECVLRRDVAIQLRVIQTKLIRGGYSLKIFDCYRPKEAVRHFINWVNARPNARGPYHPTMTRAELLKRGYIGRLSTHSQGIAVDLTIVGPLLLTDHHYYPLISLYPKNDPCNSNAKNDASAEIDFGSGFDCFDKRSHANNPYLSDDQRSWHVSHIGGMRKHGFRNYWKEWWHFTLDQ